MTERRYRGLVRTMIGARLVVDTRYIYETNQYETSLDVFTPADNKTTRFFVASTPNRHRAWHSHVDTMQEEMRKLLPIHEGERW